MALSLSFQQWHRWVRLRCRLRHSAFALVCGLICPLWVMAADAEPARQHRPEHYSATELSIRNEVNVDGGLGQVHGEYAFHREQALTEDALHEIGWLTLEKGAYIGLHAHDGTEEAYIIVAGHGVFLDGSGRAWVVAPGDVTVARRGQSHALANLFNERLEFIAVLARNAHTVAATEGKNSGIREQYKDLYPWLAAADTDRGQQYFPVAGMQEHNREHARHGEGMFLGKYALYHESARPGDALCEIAYVTLPSGAAIGSHLHQQEVNAYVVLSGSGKFVDSNGEEHRVGARSVTVTGPHQSHALRNDGPDDLLFINILARNEP